MGSPLGRGLYHTLSVASPAHNRRKSEVYLQSLRQFSKRNSCPTYPVKLLSESGRSSSLFKRQKWKNNEGKSGKSVQKVPCRSPQLDNNR